MHCTETAHRLITSNPFCRILVHYSVTKIFCMIVCYQGAGALMISPRQTKQIGQNIIQSKIDQTLSIALFYSFCKSLFFSSKQKLITFSLLKLHYLFLISSLQQVKCSVNKPYRSLLLKTISHF